MLLAAVAALPASAPPAVVAAKNAVAKDEPVLAVVGERAFTLVRLEPSSLSALGNAVPLGRSAFSWSFSADGTKVAVGGREGLRFVDTSAMRPLGQLPLPRRYQVASLGGVATFFGVQPLAWLKPRRLLVLAPPHELLVVDPVARRVVARRPLGGWVARWGQTSDRLVLLVHRPERIAPATIVVADADGALRSVRLDRILAGSKLEIAATHRTRMLMPGLAVDRARQRAYVVGAAGTVAEIGLARLAVTYRQPSSHRSLLRRLREWLEPEAGAKVVSGGVREALWLGDGLVAVWGTDHRAVRDSQGRDGQMTSPAGLQLIDTRSWRLRTIDPEASSVLRSAGLLLVSGVTYGRKAGAGAGLAAYELDGKQRFRIFAGEPVAWAGAAGGYGYAPAAAGKRGVRIVDLADGSVVEHPSGELPALLADTGSP